MKRVLFALAGFAIAYVFFGQAGPGGDSAGPLDATPPVRSSPAASDVTLARAFEERSRGVQVRGSGTVTRILPDDNDGSRHQRFIVRLASGQTLMVAHNIDLAPRVAGLRQGDTVSFYGEYEWNAEGGVIHWTHDDPRGTHVAGWVEHNGRRYQ